VQFRPIAKATIGYVPQVAHVLSGTVRDNILFGLPFDAERYGARFSAEIYTRGCHWFARLLA
jgi:ABC-type bacteriocin/lantibiotic exporter with double-glycine peptidase domain